jgi:uncharacterized protein (DUF1501 family)
MAAAEGFASVNRHVLANLMLAGGPDFRHLFPPPYDPNSSSYGYRYWQARARAHNLSTTSATDWEQRWVNDYHAVADGSSAFGILRRCGWLKRQWDAGNVAIICNAVGSTSRNHAQSIMIMDRGDVTLEAQDIGGSGWGGRAAVAAGGNVLALTPAPRRFCYGPHPQNPKSHNNASLISAADTRNIGLYQPPANYSATHPRSRLTRSLKNYYAAKRAETRKQSVYWRFIEHEQKLREFGEMIDVRLATVPIPSSIAALYSGGSPTLASGGFGRQIRNLYDAMACNDILDLRVASLEYNGWDSHKNQKTMIEPKLEDMFGDGKAFDTLYSELPDDAKRKLTIVVSGEFGRQLRANGDNGTDHGRGNAIIVIGEQVRGGVYGDMFPASELSRLGGSSPDITGLTEIDHVFGAVCDWVQPGIGNTVFPRRQRATIETGVSMSTLFA